MLLKIQITAGASALPLCATVATTALTLWAKWFSANLTRIAADHLGLSTAADLRNWPLVVLAWCINVKSFCFPHVGV